MLITRLLSAGVSGLIMNIYRENQDEKLSTDELIQIPSLCLPLTALDE